VGAEDQKARPSQNGPASTKGERDREKKKRAKKSMKALLYSGRDKRKVGNRAARIATISPESKGEEQSPIEGNERREIEGPIYFENSAKEGNRGRTADRWGRRQGREL